MKKNALAACALALAASVVVVACGGGSSSPTASPESARAVQPGVCSYAHVWITVTAISVLRDDSGTAVWQDIALAGPKRVDLLAAGNGLLQALGATPLSAGHYTQLRLVLSSSGNTVQPTGGAETALNVPSGSTSGLKLIGDITVAANSTADVAIASFDPCNAIVATGNGAYNLKPEAQATMKPVAQAGPEVAGRPGDVLPVPGGGWVLADNVNNADLWTMQPYDASGNAIGVPVTIAATVPYFNWFAALKNGGYAAVWIQNTSTLGVYEVWTQAWTAAGNMAGSATKVALSHPGGNGPPALPRIAPLEGGGYVVAWGLPPDDATGVYAQRFTSTGAPAAPAVRATDSGRGSLGLAGLASGGYLVAWGRIASASGGTRAFSAADVPLAPEQSAGSSGDGGGPPVPVLRGLAGGGAMIAWQPALQHLMMQPVDALGAALTPAQIVDDQLATPIYSSIAIGALPDGGSVIAWTEGGNAYARRYLASGAAASAQTKINVVSTDAGGPTGIAVHTDGSFEIHWSVLGSDGVRRWYVRTFPASALAG